jgi:hypothetical protein
VGFHHRTVTEWRGIPRGFHDQLLALWIIQPVTVLTRNMRRCLPVTLGDMESHAPHPKAVLAFNPRWAYRCSKCGESYWLRWYVACDETGQDLYCRNCTLDSEFFWCRRGQHVISGGWQAIQPDRERGHATIKPKPDHTRACAHCGQTFTPKRSDARYCSGRCRVAAHRAPLRG